MSLRWFENLLSMHEALGSLTGVFSNNNKLGVETGAEVPVLE